MYVLTNISQDVDGAIYAGQPTFFKGEADAVNSAKAQLADDYGISVEDVENAAYEGGTPYVISLSRDGRFEAYTVAEVEISEVADFAKGYIVYAKEEENTYRNDLKYWSNACGELHHYGKCDITKEDLPADLRSMYDEIWEELPFGLWCYLVEYKGDVGIALISEYHEYTCDGQPGEINNKDQAKKVATKLAEKYPDRPVILAEHLGMPGEVEDDFATEVVMFLKADTVGKTEFDEIAKYFGDVAYVFEHFIDLA